MYESFYKLTDKPFQLNPDPSFFYGSKQHRRAMAYLDYGLVKNEGFIIITGEVGAGKTTVVRNLLSRLDPRKVVAAHLVTTQLNGDDLLRMVAAAFGLRITATSKSEILLAIEAFLTNLRIDERRALLIVDEAQNLSHQAMEELRMLSNFQLETHGLLQSFLVGQPEFRRMLERPQMQQLRQRVVAACHISPMDAEETRAYIEHRLAHVGWTGDPQFEPQAHQAIFEASEGVPRRINSICDRMMLAGYLATKHVFTAADVEEAAQEILEETRASAASSADQPVNGSHSGEAAKLLEAGALNIDLGRLELDGDTANSASRLIAALEAGNLEERIARLERANTAIMAALRQLLGAVRSPDAPNEERP
jgi:general secretion pathway protein A